MTAVFAALLCLAGPAVVPVEGDVTDWFRRPVCPRCAGNRGLEIATRSGGVVVAPVAGQVTYVGTVGGVGYVVVAVDEVEGLNAVLGGVVAAKVALGDRVAPGAEVGRAIGQVFVGMRYGPRREGRYLDPAPLFGLERKRARLVAPGSVPVSLARRPGLRTRPATQHSRHCSVLPPVVASARGPGP